MGGMNIYQWVLVALIVDRIGLEIEDELRFYLPGARALIRQAG